MGVRSGEQDIHVVLDKALARIDTLEDAANRGLGPGYKFSTTATHLVVTRLRDGATGTVPFT